MGGRGARSELYDIMHDKPYGTEYTCVAKIGNCKILRYGDGKQSKAPVETRTRGRVYAVLDRKENIAYIVFYDRNNKRVRQIDFRHNHKVNGIPTCPHTHVGYYHDERDTRKLTDNERKRATRIITYWNKKRNNNNVR